MVTVWVGGPVGIGNQAAWDNLVAGRSGIRDVTIADLSGQDIRVGGEVPDFDPTLEMDPKDVRRHDRATQMAVAASAEALRDAGLINGSSQILPDEADPDRIGMVLGSGCGGVSILLENAKKYGTWRQSGVAGTIPTCWSTAVGDGRHPFGIRGRTPRSSAPVPPGSHAIGEAAETIIRARPTHEGAGTEAAMVPLALPGSARCGPRHAIDPDTGEYVPSIASSPFDVTRNGFVTRGLRGLVLEELEHALARGARPMAELVGYGSAATRFKMAAPPSTGRAVSDPCAHWRWSVVERPDGD